MEIEAKFRVSEAELDRIAALQSVAGYDLLPARGPEEQRNYYYDTADRRLSQARYGLRVRQIGQESLVTLKGPARVGDDGIHRRAEYEFPGGDPDPHTWPEGPARALALALLSDARLEPLLLIETRRRVIYASRGGERVAELCLDVGSLRAGPRSAAFAELEIEMLGPGELGDISALASGLAGLVELHPEPRSKLQRGLALLGEERGG